MSLANAEPIGSLDVYFPTGMRSIGIPVGSDFLLVALLAHEIYEEWDMQIRVEVIRFRPDGERECMLPLAPAGEHFAL